MVYDTKFSGEPAGILAALTRGLPGFRRARPPQRSTAVRDGDPETNGAVPGSVEGKVQQVEADQGPAEDVIARLVRGDEAEWARFCRVQGRVIHAAGQKVGLTAEEREDLLQNTCVVCYHSVDRLRDPARLGAWVYRIAYRQALELVRKRTPQATSEDREGRQVLDHLPTDAPSEEAVLEANQQAERLVGVISALGERCRRLLEVLYLRPEPPPYEEVSRELAMPIGSIGPTRARCLDRARRRWKQVSGA